MRHVAYPAEEVDRDPARKPLRVAGRDDPVIGPEDDLRRNRQALEIMTDVLLMVVLGGMGTMYGAVLGVAVFLLMQNYLQQLMGMAAAALPLPFLSELLSPDRWLFWLGVAFVASVYFFPSGIVGSLRARARKE